jgi:hypothetical protein
MNEMTTSGNFSVKFSDDYVSDVATYRIRGFVNANPYS